MKQQPLEKSKKTRRVAQKPVIRIESAGAGFGADGRPLILFEPTVFSRLTGGRFDASNPLVSQPTLTLEEIRGKSFVKIMNARRAKT